MSGGPRFHGEDRAVHAFAREHLNGWEEALEHTGRYASRRIRHAVLRPRPDSVPV
ncbi:hypothetical protein [Streptomyces sp. CNQ085]|uniref:hypothetical protein n=1 Tax=Streptomyces sp. CNQ085 TaxID=2886944 RepID=UPI001F512000|nr:hypothetical protein [Streptomyces sp. CNQ085]MCI0386943.1 hypothetical protein [Streptomyces sp. CNQ085]